MGREIMKQTTGFKIQAEDRQSWGAITMVWIGAMICVPALMIGGMIGAGLSLESAAIAIIIGYALICILMSFMGMHACDTIYYFMIYNSNNSEIKKGLPYSVSLRYLYRVIHTINHAHRVIR